MSYFNGVVLRNLRKRQRLTISDVYQLTGISRAQISNVENGKVDPRMSTVARLLTCYGASFSDLERRAPASIGLWNLMDQASEASQILASSGLEPSDPLERLNRKSELGIDTTAEIEALATRL